MSDDLSRSHPIATEGFAQVLACSVKSLPASEVTIPAPRSGRRCRDRGHHEIALPLVKDDGYFRCMTCGRGIFK